MSVAKPLAEAGGGGIEGGEEKGRGLVDGRWGGELVRPDELHVGGI